MATKRDYYEILGVTKSATKDEIKKAYRKKALEFHPDRNKAADAESKFKEVNEAYEILSNDQKRQTYDQFGHAAFDPSAGGGFGGFGGFGGTRSGRSGPFTYTYTSSGGPTNFGNFDFSDPFEIFESFFGGGGGGFARPQQRTRYSLHIDFMEAVTGAQRSLVHQGKSHTINIPAGVDNGNRIRFQDFDVSIEVGTHPDFKRDGADIYTDFEIPFTTAALGATIEVPSLTKPIKLKVRPGTQPNTMVRLAGQGIKHVHANRHGDQYVRLVVTIPKSLNRHQKDLLQQLDASLSN